MFICILYKNLNAAKLRYNTPRKYLMLTKLTAQYIDGIHSILNCSEGFYADQHNTPSYSLLKIIMTNRCLLLSEL